MPRPGLSSFPLSLLVLSWGLIGSLPAEDKLDGVWEVTSVIDDGHMLPTKAIKERLVKDARLTIQGQTMQFVAPDGKPKVRTFVTDASAKPKTVDLSATEKVGNRGIYLLDGDDLVICLSGSESQPRPLAFTSREGQDTILFSLRRVSGSAATPAPAPLPPARTPAPRTDDETRKALVGTWGHQDDRTIERITLNPDGTFSIERTWKRGLRKLLDEEQRTSGRWDVKDNQPTFTITASTDRELNGQVYSFRISSLTKTEVVYVDNQTGARRVEWRIR